MTRFKAPKSFYKRRIRETTRTRRSKTYLVWPRGEKQEAVRITSNFAETAVTEARREHFGEGPHLDWEEVEP